MLHFFIIIMNFSFFCHNFSASTFKQWKKLVLIILQNTEKPSMRKTASQNISSHHKPSQYLNKLQIKFLWTKLIPIKFYYFCKVYNVTVTKQLKFLYLITTYEKYCNSKKALCDDKKKLLSSACVFVSCLLHEKEAAL